MTQKVFTMGFCIIYEAFKIANHYYSHYYTLLQGCKYYHRTEVTCFSIKSSPLYLILNNAYIRLSEAQ